MIVKTAIAGLCLGNVVVLILLARAYHADPHPEALVVGAIVTGIVLFGLVELLRPIWRD